MSEYLYDSFQLQMISGEAYILRDITTLCEAGIASQVLLGGARWRFTLPLTDKESWKRLVEKAHGIIALKRVR